MMRKIGWKKATALWMGMVIAVGLVGCGSQGGTSRMARESSSEAGQEESTSSESSQESTLSESTEENTQESTVPESTVEGEGEQSAGQDGTGETGKTLVVYYSATGHTENVANYIAAATDADIFVIEPVEPYTGDDLNWSDENSRVSREHENEDERNVELVSTTVEGWDSYDTVFIGYPIWWHIAAWPVDGFVTANDFTGKTVIPFCTSSSSGLEESGELLAEAAGTGNWLEGERFSSGASEETVQEWVAGLNLE